jgi:hypothetical protein
VLSVSVTCFRFLADSGVEVGKGRVLEGGSEGGSRELTAGAGWKSDVGVTRDS